MNIFGVFVSFLLIIEIQIANSFGYCVDAYCPFKCCQDFYTCAVSSDCQSTYKSYSWPYEEGSNCGSDSDCKSDCCYKDKCYDKGTCTIVRAAIGGVFGLTLFIIVVRVILAIRRKRKNKEAINSEVAKAGAGYDEVNTDASFVIDNNNDKFNAKGYVDDKLVMNAQQYPNGMPCKPKPGENIIVSDFKVSTY